MSIYDLIPTKKVTAFLMGGAVTVAGFWLAITFGPLDDWPEAWVMAAFALIVGFIIAWFVPPTAWERVRQHLEGTVSSDSEGGPSTEVEGDVTLTPTSEGMANIEGEVAVDEEGEIASGETGELFSEGDPRD